MEEMDFPLSIFLSELAFVYVLIFLDENGFGESSFEDFFVGLVSNHPFHL